MENYFAVVCKCGHVGRNNYVLITFPVISVNKKPLESPDIFLEANIIIKICASLTFFIESKMKFKVVNNLPVIISNKKL